MLHENHHGLQGFLVHGNARRVYAIYICRLPARCCRATNEKLTKQQRSLGLWSYASL